MNVSSVTLCFLNNCIWHRNVLPHHTNNWNWPAVHLHNPHWQKSSYITLFPTPLLALSLSFANEGAWDCSSHTPSWSCYLSRASLVDSPYTVYILKKSVWGTSPVCNGKSIDCWGVTGSQQKQGLVLKTNNMIQQTHLWKLATVPPQAAS